MFFHLFEDRISFKPLQTAAWAGGNCSYVGSVGSRQECVNTKKKVSLIKLHERLYKQRTKQYTVPTAQKPNNEEKNWRRHNATLTWPPVGIPTCTEWRPQPHLSQYCVARPLLLLEPASCWPVHGAASRALHTGPDLREQDRGWGWHKS